MKKIIREELPADRAAIRAVNEAAFGCSNEANLVEKLHDERAVLLSLVAEIDGQIAGHILFNRMLVETENGSIAAVSLAPMSVAPEHQQRGIGSELVRTGLTKLRERGEAIVIVLGHEHYYSRFGFSAEKARQIESPFPPEAFMALELSPGALFGIRGRAVYPIAFGI